MTPDLAATPIIPVKWRGPILLVILLFGAGLRVYGLAAYSLWYDEGASLFLAQYAVPPTELFDTSNTNEPPMMAVLSWLWQGLVGLAGMPHDTWPSDFLLRLLPCLLGIAAIPLVFLVTRHLVRDEWTALIAAGLFALNPFQIYYAQEIRIYAFYLVLALLALFYMQRALETNHLRHWALFVLCEVLMMYSHFISVWTIFAYNCVFLSVLWWRRDRFWQWTFSQAAMMILVIPALRLAWAMNQVVLGLEVEWAENPTWKTGLITFKNFFAGYSYTPMVYWPLFFVALLLFVAGLLSLMRKPGALFPILLLTLVPVIGNVILWSWREFSFYEHRLFIFSGIAALMGVACGLRALRLPGLIAAATAGFVLLTVPTLRDHYRQNIHEIEQHRLGIFQKVDFRGAAQYIHAHYKDGDLVVHPGHFTIYSMHHYLHVPHQRLGFSWDVDGMKKVLGNESLLRRHGLMPHMLERVLPRPRRLWLLETTGITFEWKPSTEFLKEQIEAAGYRKAEVVSLYGIDIILYERTAPAPVDAA